MLYTFLQVVVGFSIIFKIYLKLTTGRCKNHRCLVGKTIIVTGANTGIGFETALEFAKRGAKVILACRNIRKAEAARLRIIEKTDNPNVFVKIVDMCSFDSVRKFAEEINKNEERLDILINNAGSAPEGTEKTEDGYYVGMQTNYFSVFLLTNLLLELLKKSEPSRIVNVSSLLAYYPIYFNVKNLCEHKGAVDIYSRSKLCINLFTKELARRLQGTQVTVYSLHPGAVSTEVFRYATGFLYLILAPVKHFFAKNCEEGAQTTIYCATEKCIENFSGCHFEDCRRIEDYWTVKNKMKYSRTLWEMTEEITNLK